MDLIYRKKKYRDALERVRRLNMVSQKAVDIDDYINALQDETNELIETFRKEEDFNEVRIHYILLLFPLIVSGIWLAFSRELLLPPLYLLLGIIAFVWIAHRLMQSIIASHQMKLAQKEYSMIDKSFVLSKLEYLDGGIEIRRRRLLLIALFYILFFPVLLLLLQKIGLGEGPFDHIVLNILLAYGISTPMWFWYFNQIFNEYEDVETTIRVIRDKLSA